MTEPIIKALLVVSFTDTMLYGFDSKNNAYLLAYREYEGESWQTPEPHPYVLIMAQGLLLAGVNAYVHYLNPDGETLYFSERFRGNLYNHLIGKAVLVSNATASATWKYLDDRDWEFHTLQIEGEDIGRI